MALTAAQEPFLRLIGLSGQWNAFDGSRIEGALRAHPHLWQSVVFTRSASTFVGKDGPTLRNQVDLIVLRDLSSNIVNLDTLFILAEPGMQDALQVLAEGWNADDVSWVDRGEAFPAMGAAVVVRHDFDADPSRVILAVWWD